MDFSWLKNVFKVEEMSNKICDEVRKRETTECFVKLEMAADKISKELAIKYFKPRLEEALEEINRRIYRCEHYYDKGNLPDVPDFVLEKDWPDWVTNQKLCRVYSEGLKIGRKALEKLINE